MRRFLSVAAVALLAAPALLGAQPRGSEKCDPENAGIRLPQGFCATVYAEKIGVDGDTLKNPRHMVVAPNGDVIVSAQGRGGVGGVWILRDENGDGKADKAVHFARGFTSSEVALFDGHLYTETSTEILRYPFPTGTFAAAGNADTVAEELPKGGSHQVKTFTIDRAGNLYVNFGTATNSCQTADRQKESPGKNPCDEVEIRGGIWKFDARKLHQKPSAENHFARGIRNAVGIAMNPLDGKLWTTQHGRDGLGGEPENSGQWPQSAHYNAENPAEELIQPNQGDDFGWPYCYYAVEEHHLVLAPEYGGDGKKTGQCAPKKEPVAVFPAHWAPNGLMFYTGSSFPAKYKSGAFIAFHGSWNRAPEPQQGYNVVFQPLNGGKAAGAFEVFAEGFGPRNPGNHRPTGLAQGTDGSLFVADDAGGRIYKIVYDKK
ncbi:MAG TPA: PQQ-dependent sugar dehydrogenase [Gemmatimonadaceae bacterium]|nr:PQQ-dependent sugar dehydrogenase [Gemmatimonadaceae bacterium]